MSIHASRTLLRVSVLALCALPMHGETGDTRAFAGSVSDSNGALVVDAGIVVKSEATQKERDLATYGEGNMSVQFLPTDRSDLTVQATGFESFTLNGVAVSASPRSLQMENATLGRDIDQETVVDLPLVDGNFTGTLGLTARINTDIVDASQQGAGSQETRAGIAIPALDTIQEFKVQTSLYDAQYGRRAGANVDVETRSGSDLYGDAYYFGRNEIPDANNFFASATGVPTGEFRRSQPGGTLRGPTPSSQTQAAKTGDNDVYRHSAAVQSLARMMHLQVETTARLFENFNFLVLVLGIGIPLGRFLPKLLRKRSEKIRGDLETARRTTEDANTRLSAVEAKLASLDQEIAKFRAEVEQLIALDEQQSKAALEEEIARVIASAEQEIGVAAAQAKRSLRHFAADLAIDQAVKKLVLTPETDRALIAEFISETGRAVCRAGSTSP